MTTAQRQIFKAAIEAANQVLVESPEAIDLERTKEGRWFWVETSAKAKKARKQLREVLNNLWQASATNYEEIQRGMRVDNEQVLGLIDQDFIEKYEL